MSRQVVRTYGNAPLCCHGDQDVRPQVKGLHASNSKNLLPLKDTSFKCLLSYSAVEPLNKDTFGTSRFVLCREVVLFQR